MSIVFVLVPLALILAGVAVAAYAWAARRGQFDDLRTPALRMLHDDDAPRPTAGPATPPVDPPADRGTEPPRP